MGQFEDRLPVASHQLKFPVGLTYHLTLSSKRHLFL
jgi:hypothetical protein